MLTGRTTVSLLIYIDDAGFSCYSKSGSIPAQTNVSNVTTTILGHCLLSEGITLVDNTAFVCSLLF